MKERFLKNSVQYHNNNIIKREETMTKKKISSGKYRLEGDRIHEISNLKNVRFFLIVIGWSLFVLSIILIIWSLINENIFIVLQFAGSYGLLFMFGILLLVTSIMMLLTLYRQRKIDKM